MGCIAPHETADTKRPILGEQLNRMILCFALRSVSMLCCVHSCLYLLFVCGLRVVQLSREKTQQLLSYGDTSPRSQGTCGNILHRVRNVAFFQLLSFCAIFSSPFDSLSELSVYIISSTTTQQSHVAIL